MNDMPAVRVGQHASRSDHQDRRCGTRRTCLSPAISRSRAAKVSCIESEKLITMISGVITLRNMLRLEIEPAERAERQQDRDQRRARRDDHERDAAEEQDRDQAAGEEADGVVDEPVALDRVADFELHHRHAGELAGQPGAVEIARRRSCGSPRRPCSAPWSARSPDRAPARSAPACRPPTAACRG